MKADPRLTQRDRQVPFPELVRELYIPVGGYKRIKADFPDVYSMASDLSKFFYTARLYGESFRAMREAEQSEAEWRDRNAGRVSPATISRGAGIEVIGGPVAGA